jgi:hypothetical protein
LTKELVFFQALQKWFCFESFFVNNLKKVLPLRLFIVTEQNVDKEEFFQEKLF